MATVTDAADIPPARVGPYRLEKRLGAGGMGQVYRAFDERLERRVALKQILPGSASDSRVRKRFLREARAAASLNHPAIVQIHDILEVDGCDWIVMELADGETLDDLVARGPLPPGRVLEMAVELAGGLRAAHGEGIVHRDLKAKNVLVTGKGRIKILDFGLAKPIETGERDLSISVAGQVVGTPRAMSPEQATGGDIDHRSDLFSLGILLYEMATGESPFVGPTVMATITRVCTHRQRPVHEVNPAVSEAFSALVDRLLEKEPADRPQTAGEVWRELAELADTAAHPAPAPAAEASDSVAETLVGPGETPVAEDRRRTTVERRQITVMACELVDAGKSPEGLDPETLVQVVPELHALVGEAIAEFGGHLGSGLGHRLVVYFGYPRAHEDDARRAVNAALQILAEVDDLNDRIDAERPAELALRIGIHTGLAVVMPDGSGAEQVALGQTLEVANRVESLASPNTVAVSPATHSLIEGFFVEEPMAPAELPGFGSPVAVHRVASAHDIHTRVELAEPLLPLIGRRQELDLLLSRWQLACGGDGQVVLLSGEAGIGKSRLVYTLERRLREDGAQWLMCYASAYAQSSPLRPLIELLRRVLEIDGGDASGQLERLEDVLRRYGSEPVEVVPLLAPLLGLEPAERYPPPAMSPEKQRSETMEAILTLLMAMADRQPLALVMEDLHWMDPSTLELLGLLIDQASAAPLLLVLTFRNEFEAPWGHRAYLTQLNLHRLVGEELESLIDRVPGGEDLPADVRRQIVDKTDGVPLFVEELTKAVLESRLLDSANDSSGIRAGLDIPATLRDSLTARLDRLGAAKEVAQLAAVIGRGFRHQLLAAVSTLGEAALEQELERLVSAELVMRRGFGSRARYVFKHALIQDAAYDSLLMSTRRTHHRRIARALQDLFPESAKTRPELLAHHYTEAGEIEAAIRYWLEAGRMGVARSANLEAVGHLEQGLALIESLPEDRKRERLELESQALLGPVYLITRGFAAPEAERAFARAYELCGRIGESSQLGWALKGLFQYYSTIADFSKTEKLAELLMNFARSQEDRHVLMSAHFCLGMDLFTSKGRIADAREQFERGVALDSPDRELPGSRSGGDDPGLENLAMLSLSLWFLGYPDQSLQRSDEALKLARNISGSFPTFALSWALAWKVFVHHCRGEMQAVSDWAEEAIDCCREAGALIWLAHTEALLGSALAETGEPVSSEPESEGLEAHGRGIEMLQRSIESFVACGALSAVPYTQYLLARARLHLGRTDRSLLQEALAGLAVHGNSGWGPEFHRVDGEMALVEGRGAGDGGMEEAESRFRQAIEIARDQQTRSLELRAAVSLGRLWQRQGKRKQARDLLTGIYDWFAEGFETADLRQAKALLEELS